MFLSLRSEPTTGNVQGNLREAELTIMSSQECFQFGQYMDSETTTILKVPIFNSQKSPESGLGQK